MFLFSNLGEAFSLLIIAGSAFLDRPLLAFDLLGEDALIDFDLIGEGLGASLMFTLREPNCNGERAGRDFFVSDTALSFLNKRTVCLDDGLRSWALRPLIFSVFSLAAAVAALVLLTVCVLEGVLMSSPIGALIGNGTNNVSFVY